MKNKKMKNFMVIVLFAAIASLVVIAGTYAKYTSASAGTGVAQVAKWSFKVNGSDAAALAQVALVDTSLNGKVADGKVAPGTDGGVGVTVDASGSEVAVDYSVEISNIQNKPTNLKFYSDATYTAELAETAPGSGIYRHEGSIALADVGTVVNVPIYWKWAYETTGADATDTAEGKAAASMTFDVSVTGTQQDPTQP